MARKFFDDDQFNFETQNALGAIAYGCGDTGEILSTVERIRDGDAAEIAHQITAPIFIADPEHEQFWPGQSRQLYDLVSGPKTLVPFTAAEGADRHCEPMARTLLEQRMFDWLDETIGRN